MPAGLRTRRLHGLLVGSGQFLTQAAVGLVRSNGSPLALRLRRKLLRTHCMIDTDVVVVNRNNFSAGIGSALYHGSYILNHFGTFSIGKNSHLGAFCYVNACYGNVVVGDDVAVGPGTKIVAYSNHYAPGRKVTEERVTADVVIGNNVFIGANCTLLPGTRICDNVVVAAGAVVKGALEENAIYGGVPCKRLKAGWYA